MITDENKNKMNSINSRGTSIQRSFSNPENNSQDDIIDDDNTMVTFTSSGIGTNDISPSTVKMEHENVQNIVIHASSIE